MRSNFPENTVFRQEITHYPERLCNMHKARYPPWLVGFLISQQISQKKVSFYHRENTKDFISQKKLPSFCTKQTTLRNLVKSIAFIKVVCYYYTVINDSTDWVHKPYHRRTNNMAKRTKKNEVVAVEEVKVDETKVEEAVVEEVSKEVEKKAKKNKEKKAEITIMNNDEFRKLFIENGCAAGSNAKVESSVVYQQFGTKSRILQQKKAYQLLLTNGHKMTKTGIVDTENDDVARFTQFYNTLSDEEKVSVVGYDTIQDTKLSESEMPRERTCKINKFDVLVKFIQFMSGFEENKVVVTE